MFWSCGLPEVKTLLEGVTVGGKKLEDVQQIIARGGTVQLASGGIVPGTEHGEGGALLREHFADLVEYLSTVSDARRRALTIRPERAREG
jgi:hypothetical protein